MRPSSVFVVGVMLALASVPATAFTYFSLGKITGKGPGDPGLASSNDPW